MEFKTPQPIPEIYQKNLYRQEVGIWHYLRLFWLEEQQIFEVRSAICGQNAVVIGQEALKVGETKADALRRLVSALMRAGYRTQPKKIKELNVVINTPDWDGFIAGAPWFDQLQSDFLHPLYAYLDETANGSNIEGLMIENGRITHYLGVLDREATLSKIAELAQPLEVAFNITISTTPSIPLPRPPLPEEVNSGIAKELLTAWREAMTKISEGVKQAFISAVSAEKNSNKYDPDPPFSYYERISPNRVRGEKAAQLREKLMTVWGIGKYYWPPLGNSATCNTIHVEGLDRAIRLKLIECIRPKTQGNLYVFEIEEGIFLTTPDDIINHYMDESYVFDEGMEWIVYSSHHGTTTFGGDWLIAAVKELYRDREEELNPWF
jgi:hypothetical protein